MADLAHRSFSREANAWFPTVAKANGFTFESTTDWNRITTLVPAAGRVVMFFDNTPHGAAQLTAFQTYMEKGAAWLGFHVSGYNDVRSDPLSTWYHRDFIGAGKFVKNTWRATFANLKVEDTTHPVTATLGSLFKSAPSEWYAWEVDLRTKPNIKILCSVDPSSFPLGTEPPRVWLTGYYPIVWTNTNYKMVYMNTGHNDMDYGPKPDGITLSFTFSTTEENQMILNAIHWLGTTSKSQ